MPARDLAWRLGGLVPLAASIGTSLIHRSVLASAGHGPATVAEMVLALLSLTLASLGVLLLINGVRLRDDWRHGLLRLDRTGRSSARRRSEPGDPIDGAADSAAHLMPTHAVHHHRAAFIGYYVDADETLRACSAAWNPTTRRSDRSV